MTTDGDDRFEWSDSAKAALNHPLGSKPHVVSSSRKFGKDHPPHPEARDRYYKFLAQGQTVTDDVKKRFKCTAGKRGEDAAHIVFNFTSKGPTLASVITPTAMPASSGGGGYGAT